MGVGIYTIACFIIVIERKLENRLGIQNSACGENVIIIRLKLVKEGADDRKYDNDKDVAYVIEVLLELLSPWINTQRIVCADSHFKSVTAVEFLYENEMKFIGVVKTATRKFPMGYLAVRELENRGYLYGLVRQEDD